ncbi:hypothetical protein ONZ45_g16107 [Pleurotus djamor]|nr:hypothetical protein ONZ45_g16107 [Pleurotus djamor]
MSDFDVASLIAKDGGDSDETTLHEHELTISEWEHSNPSLALSLLSNEEVNALAPMAQSDTVHFAKSDSDAILLQWRPIATFTPFIGHYILGVLLVGRIAWDSRDFTLKTFVSLSEIGMLNQPKARTVWVKGPGLQGKTNSVNHVGPIQINLPFVGVMDLWARELAGFFYATVKISDFMSTGAHRKRILMAKRPVVSAT